MNRLRDQQGRYVKRVHSKAGIPSKPTPFDPKDQPSLQDVLTIPRDRNFIGNMVLPHEMTFSALWQSVSQSYRTLDDEAKRHNYQNSLAMRRDASLFKLLRARQYPTVELPHTIEVEDPDDPFQKEVARDLVLMVNAVPKFQYLKLNLMEANWYGKAAVQVEWNWIRINGKQRLIPTSHKPVNGDKIVHKWDGTPGVLIYKPYAPDGADIEQTNWGPALFLTDDYYRDRFIIHEFEPDDVDYLFESDIAGAVHGIGLRSRIYWIYQLREQVLKWIVDSMQRLSTNGMLVGYYPAGNSSARDTVGQALKDLAQNSVCLFPVDELNEQISRIEAIAPATVAYGELFNALKYFDEIIETMFLGQPLSSGTESTGMGSNVAELHALTFERIIRADSQALSETLTNDLLGPMIKYNYGELPFQVKLKLQVEKTNVKDLLVSAKAMYDMRIPMDVEDLRDKAGFIAPRDPDKAVIKQDSDDLRVGDQDKVGSVVTNTELGY